MIYYIYKELTMSKADTIEKIIVEKTFNHIKQHSSIMFAVGKKVSTEFPEQTVKIKQLVDRIIELNVLRLDPIDHEILQSNDLIECLSFMQNTGEQAEIDINRDLRELKNTVQDLPEDKKWPTYQLAETLLSFYQHGIGYIYQEVKRILLSKTNNSTM